MTRSEEQIPRPSIRIGNREIGTGHEPFIIAEIGTSHSGDLDRAHRLIDEAAAAGADCAKFQVVYAEEILHPNTGTVALPGGEVPLFERFRSLERSGEFYADLMEYTRASGLVFLCSAFGIRSARLLRELKVEAVKIASPELNHVTLLREVSSYGLPILLSTGVSLLCDIEQALQIVGTDKVALLHCVTAYPAPAADYNLRVMGGLQSLFGVPVGVSDHSLDPVIVPCLAAAMGAAIIEKHLTLAKEDGGLDDPVALPPADFHRMSDELRRAARSGLTETMERLSAENGREALTRVLGSGRKRLAPSEERNYRRSNRSLHAVTDLPAGTALTSENTAVLRTEKKLRPGLSPHLLGLVIGCKTLRDIPAGEGIEWDDLITK